MVADLALVDTDAAPRRYLRTAMAVARSSRHREYMVFDLGSGSFFRTDGLGAIGARALIEGLSDVEAIELVERIEVGSGKHFRSLIEGLEARNALANKPPLRVGWRRRRRRLAIVAVAVTLSVGVQLVRVAPTSLLAWLDRILPSTPLGTHVWHYKRFTIVDNLRATGYASQPESWLRDVSRRISAHTLTDWLFMYLSVTLKPHRLDRFIGRRFDPKSMDDVARSLHNMGAFVAVFLRGPMSMAVPNVLRARGVQVVRTTKGDAHGVNVSNSTGPLSDFFGDAPEKCIDLAGPYRRDLMLGHLAGGRSVHVALDMVPDDGADARIEFLGHAFARNDEPALLAVESGRPVVFLNNYLSPSQTVLINRSPIFYPDLSLPPTLAVATLSERLYAYAESVIREHPESWPCWTYLGRLQGSVARAMRPAEAPPCEHGVGSEPVLNEASPAGREMQMRKYLRGVIAVARSPLRGEYLVFHPNSGTSFRTDHLGARAVQALLEGRSNHDAIELVERIEPGAGKGARRLIAGMDVIGALTPLPSPLTSRRWFLRRLATKAIGLALGVAVQLAWTAPTSLMVWIYRTLPASPLGRRVWLANRRAIIENLKASGYATQSERWLNAVSWGCTVSLWTNRYWWYLTLAISPKRLGRVLDRLVDRDSFEDLAHRLRKNGPAVVVFLHEPLTVALPNALRSRGVDMIRTIRARAHGAMVSQRSKFSHYFGDPPENVVNVDDPLVTGIMLRHLKAGRSVYIALDRVASGKTAADVEMVGHRIPRNDGPAWLAVRTGRPLVFVSSHLTPSRTVRIRTYPTLCPDASLVTELRVSDLSERLYAYADCAVREHPEGWSGWAYLSRIRGNPRRDGAEVTGEEGRP